MQRMKTDFLAFLAKLFAIGAYETRDEPTVKSVADALDKIATAFEEFKRTNDSRLEAVKAGASTADLDAKLAKINEHITGLNEMKSKIERVEEKLALPGLLNQQRADGETREAAEYRNAFVSWMRQPADHERQAKVTATARALETRTDSVITGTGALGGFALPEMIERAIARLSVDISPIRAISTVRQVGTTDYKELFDVGGAAFEWLGEGDTRNQTGIPNLAEVAPFFGMASAKPQASEESLDDLFFNVEDWLTSSVAEALAAGEGAAFVSGNGSKKPKGFLAGATPVTTADSSRAFGTLMYHASGQASAMPTSPDVFIDMIYSLRARYRANAQWVTSKSVLAALRKYKDGTSGQYLWQPALTAGMPQTFLGFPVTEAEDMPSVAGNAFPLAFGDFREGYLIADRVGTRVTRDEITTPGYVKFYVRKRVGGCIRNSQAIRLLKISST